MRRALRGIAMALAAGWIAGAVGCASGRHQDTADAAATATASASGSPAASTSPKPAGWIEQAAFNQDADGARLVLSADAPILYTAYEPRPDLLVIDLPGIRGRQLLRRSGGLRKPRSVDPLRAHHGARKDGHARLHRPRAGGSVRRPLSRPGPRRGLREPRSPPSRPPSRPRKPRPGGGRARGDGLRRVADGPRRPRHRAPPPGSRSATRWKKSMPGRPRKASKSLSWETALWPQRTSSCPTRRGSSSICLASRTKCARGSCRFRARWSRACASRNSRRRRNR